MDEIADAALIERERAIAKKTAARNPYIHGARGCFSFALFIFHVLNSGLPPEFMAVGTPRFFAQMLQYGVELFFGISGMVIVGAYIRARSPFEFIIDRITRIFPTLWATVFVVFLLVRFSGERVHFSSFGQMMAILLANLLALPNMLPIPLIHPAAWSLSYEFTFYLLFVLFGVLYRYCGARAWWGVVPLGLCILAGHIRGIFLVSGVLIAIGIFEKPWLRWATRMPLAWICVFLLAWQSSVVVSGRQIEQLNIFLLMSNAGLGLLITIGSLAGTFALAGIFDGRGWLGHLLCRPVFQWLGTISYSLYLWQMPVMAIVKRLMHTSGMVPHLGDFAQPALFLLALPPTLIISSCSQKFFEVRITRWLRGYLKMGGTVSRHV